MHSIRGLENGIVNAKANIKVLEGAIDRERNTIKEYRVMIDSIEHSDRLLAEACENTHIEIIRDDAE